ncbi:hypothetical protein DAPPUDRAFT_340477, partial [Daphnia pulex]
MDPTDAAFFAFHTPKAATFAGESAAKTSPGQSFDNAAHVQGGFRGRGRGPYFTGEWRGRGRGRGGRGGRDGGSSNPHNHSYARKDGQQQNDQQQSSQHAGSVVCFNCNGNGHKAYQCPTKREEERGQARQENFNKKRGFGSTDCNVNVEFTDTQVFFANKETNEKFMTGSRVENSLYRLCATTKNPTELNEESSTALYGVGNGSTNASLELWHRRFGHLNCQDILKINKSKA